MERTLLDYYRDLEEEGVVLFFNGPVSQGVVEGIGDIIRQKVATSDVGMRTARRVFSVMVEQMQNVISYSSDRDAGTCGTLEESDALNVAEVHDCIPSNANGQIIIRRNADGYYVACSNRILTQDEERIRRKVETVNGMSKNELKEYYREQRRHGPDETSLGAGLGFIEMARKASKPLDIEFQKLDDSTSVFSVAVRI